MVSQKSQTQLNTHDHTQSAQQHLGSLLTELLRRLWLFSPKLIAEQLIAKQLIARQRKEGSREIQSVGHSTGQLTPVPQ